LGRLGFDTIESLLERTKSSQGISTDPIGNAAARAGRRFFGLEMQELQYGGSYSAVILLILRGDDAIIHMQHKTTIKNNMEGY
jgi:hypothetical protein